MLCSVLLCSVHHRHRLGDLEFLILVMRSSGAQLQRVSSSPLQKSKATVATTLQLSLSWVVDGEGGLWTVESAEDRGVRRVLEVVTVDCWCRRFGLWLDI